MINFKENKSKYQITISKDLSISDFLYLKKKIKSMILALQVLAIKNDLKRFVRIDGDCNEK